MSNPLHKHDGPQRMIFWRRFCPCLQIRWGWNIRGQLPQIFFVPLKILLCSENITLSPLICISSPPTLKPGYGPDSAKIMSAI